MRHSEAQAAEIKALRSLLERSLDLNLALASTPGCGDEKRQMVNSLRDEYRAIANSKADGRRKK